MAIGIVIALNNEESGHKVKNILITAGYSVLALCTSGNELIRTVRQVSPNIIVLGYKFNDMTLLDIYNSLGDDYSYLAIVNEPYKSFVQEETEIFCINNPINTFVLTSSIEMIIQSEIRIMKLKQKVISLENKIAERKSIEKAKGILMETEGLTENEAFKYIQKNSMNLGIKMIDFAEKIILNK